MNLSRSILEFLVQSGQAKSLTKARKIVFSTSRPVETPLHKDGYEKMPARIKTLGDILPDTADFLRRWPSQDELEQSVGNIQKPGSINPEEAAQSLVALQRLAPFPVSPYGIAYSALTAYRATSDTGRRVLRNLSAVRPGERHELVRKIIDDDNLGVHPLALYFQTLLNQTPALVPQAVEVIDDYGLWLPVVASVSLSQLQTPCRETARSALYGLDEVLKSDKIVPKRHVSHNAGVSTNPLDSALTDIHHYSTLSSGDEHEAEACLIYVDGKLVASMKMHGTPSLVALRTVVDSQGRFPLVIGGIYSTSVEIKNQAVEAYRNIRQAYGPGVFASINAGYLPVLPLHQGFSTQDQLNFAAEFVNHLRFVRKNLIYD